MTTDEAILDKNRYLSVCLLFIYDQFTSIQLLGMARSVSSGMKYLHDMGYIHRVNWFL